MPKLDCLFHFICQCPAEFGEHVVQAALGGRRPDRRLLCKACQTRFSVELDPVLPEQLRHMNAWLGVEGDHTGSTPMPMIEDQVTGEQYLVDARLGFNSAKEKFVDTGKSEDGKTTFRRYTVTGQVAQQRLLKKIRKSGAKFEMLKVTTRRYLLPRAVETPTSMGGEHGQRAVGRFALNVLGSTLPQLAREPGLQAFKRWIYEGSNNLDFANFANALPPEVCPPSPYEFGHRVVFGADAAGNIFARVSFFEAFEYALRLGTVDEPPESLIVIDINPLATRAGEGIDILRRSVDAGAFDCVELGRFVSDQERLALRAEAAYARVAAVGQERAWRAILDELVPTLNATRALDEGSRPAAIREALAQQLQVAMNLLLTVAPSLVASYKSEGRLLHAMFIEDILDPKEAEASETGVLAARWALARIEALFAAKLATGKIDNATARHLLQGEPGLRAAATALVEGVNAGLAAFDAAQAAIQGE